MTNWYFDVQLVGSVEVTSAVVVGVDGVVGVVVADELLVVLAFLAADWLNGAA